MMRLSRISPDSHVLSYGSSLIVLLLILAVAPCVAAVPTAPLSSYDRLQTLAKTITFDWAKLHPLNATNLGIAGEDGQLDTPSAAENARDLALIRRWQRELAAIPLQGAPLKTVDDATLLRAQLVSMERQYTVYKVYEKDPSAPSVAILSAIYTQFLHLPIPGTNGATDADVATAWQDIISRLQRAPSYIAAGNALVTHPGHLYGVTGAEQLAGAPGFLDGPLTAAAKQQLPAGRFAAFVKARDATIAAMNRTRKYIDAHAASWPENFAMGLTAYNAMLRDEQLLPYDASDLERMGRAELAHGWTVQTWVQSLAAGRGTPIGPETGGGLAPGGPALVGYYRARLAQLRQFVDSHHVVDVPSWLGKMDVLETPKFLQPVSPGASMNPPRLFSKGTTGFYFITPPTSLVEAAKTLNVNEDFDRDRILSTAAHEAMPGHFLQLSIARRDPDFVRKIQGSSSFIEGWAYYGEDMFVQLGLYGDDLDGRYYVAQWERVRGARAIVDPELASGNWSYGRAVKFFARETGFTPQQSKAAVAGIALEPGYVIAYTAGRAQIENLLAEYRIRMGSRASLRDFHDRLLCYGSTPLSIVGPELIADLSKPLAEVRAAAGY
jgi:uncharacterized protein (DUF885 family)